MSTRIRQVLLVEDHPGDITLARRAFARLATPNALTVVLDGVEAMAFLRRQGKHRNAPRPDLILLDLNMPRKDGRQVLREIDADPGLRAIPVIVLTTSGAPRDVQEAYDLGANGYVPKPPSFVEFEAVISSIEQFWFGTALLP